MVMSDENYADSRLETPDEPCEECPGIEISNRPDDDPTKRLLELVPELSREREMLVMFVMKARVPPDTLAMMVEHAMQLDQNDNMPDTVKKHALKNILKEAIETRDALDKLEQQGGEGVVKALAMDKVHESTYIEVWVDVQS